MKICAVSDLHGKLPYIQPCDVLCICGDISPLKIQNRARDMRRWLQNKFSHWIDSLPCSTVLLIGGNHDFCIQEHPEIIRGITGYNEKLFYLLDNKINISGKIFYGTPWCPDLKNWAFYGDSEFLQEVYSMIPEKVDVLLTHCPPRIEDFGRVMQASAFNYGANYGCYELAEAIKEKKPLISIFGHVHTGWHPLEKVGDTRYSNVSILDEDYEQTYFPLYFEI